MAQPIILPGSVLRQAEGDPFGPAAIEDYLRRKEQEQIDAYLRHKEGAATKLARDVRDTLAHLGQTARQGVTKGVGGALAGLGDVQEALTQGMSDINPLMPAALKERVKRADAARAAAGLTGDLQRHGEAMKQVAEEAYPVDRSRADLGTQAVATLGQMAPIVAAAPFSGPAAAVAAAGQMGNAAKDDVRASLAKRGKEPTEQERRDLETRAVLLNAPAGLISEAALGVPRMLRAARAMQGATAARRIGGALAKGAVREGAQEGLERLLQNAGARAIGYDPERPLLEGVPEDIAMGALVGGPLNASFAGAQELDAQAALRAYRRRLDTAQNVPEGTKTLLLQQRQLALGLRPAQMFPARTPELDLPEGMERVENERGVFHFNPAQVTREQVLAASAAGRENVLLGFGPVSKPEAEARAAATGEPLVAVVERAPDGTEVKAAAGTAGTAAAQAAALERGKLPGSTVRVETPQRVIEGRAPGLLNELLNRDAKAAAAQAEAEAKEREARAARNAELEARRARFEEHLAAARALAADPEAGFPAIQGAVTTLRRFAEDNALGLQPDQRRTALAAAHALEPRAAALKADFDARREQAAQARRLEADAREAARAEARRAEAARMDAIARTGRDPRTGALEDITRLADDELAALDPDAEGLSAQEVEREFGRRERAAAAQAGSAGYTLRDLFAGRREALRAAGLARPLRLPTPEAERGRGGLGGELAGLRQDGVPFAVFDGAAAALDRTAETLRGLGFRVETEADVVELVRRAYQGEHIAPSFAGEVDFAQQPGQYPARGPQKETRAAEEEAPRPLPEAAGGGSATSAQVDAGGPGRRLSDIEADIERGGTWRDAAARAVNFYLDKQEGRPAPWPAGRDGSIVLSLEEALAREVRAYDSGARFVFPTTALRDRVLSYFATKADAPPRTWRDVAAPPAAPRLLTAAEIDREFKALLAALPELAAEWRLTVDEVERALRAEGFDRAADVAARTRPGAIRGATVPMDEPRARLAGYKRFIVVSTQAARKGQLGGIALHEIAHGYFDQLPAETRAYLRELHEHETGRREGPLYSPEGDKLTDIAITAAELPAARVAADPDLPVKEWFVERVRKLNEDWLAGRMARAEAPALLRIWRGLLDALGRVFARERGLDPEADLFTDTFRAWLRTGGRADVAPAAIAYAQREAAQFASAQALFDLGGAALGLDLPPAIRNLAPRWQDKTLRFDSSLDKALYYAGGEGNTATRTAVVDHLARQTGLSAGQIATLARELRRKLGPLARTAATDGLLRVPPQMQAAARALTGADFAAAARRAQPLTGGVTEEQLDAPLTPVPLPAAAPSLDDLKRLLQSISRTRIPQLGPVAISGNRRAHLLHDARGERDRRTLGVMPNLLEHAQPIGRPEADNTGRKGTTVRRAVALIADGDQLMPVVLTLHADHMGVQLHSFTVRTDKKAALDQYRRAVSTGETQPIGPSATPKVRDFVAEVKRAPDGTAVVDFATDEPADQPRRARAETLKANPPAGVKTAAALEAEQREQQARASEAARLARHPAAQGDVEPGDAWASTPKLTDEQLTAERQAIGTFYNERYAELSAIERSHLNGRLDALQLEWDRRHPAATPEEIVAAAPRVGDMPRPDRAEALRRQWRAARRLRDDGLRTGNTAAQDEGQRGMKAAERALDLLGVDQADLYDAPARPDQAAQDDGRNLPPPPPAETGERAPAPDEGDGYPVRPGKALEVVGHSAVRPPLLERGWRRVRDSLRGFRGSIPELPAQPFRAAVSDPFIARHGRTFYARVQQGLRALVGANDYVQKTAEEQVRDVTGPLLALGGRFDAESYRRLLKRKEQVRRLAAEGRPVPAGVQAELEALRARMESHPYMLFQQAVLFLDLNWRATHLKDSQGNPIRLPFGINPREVRAELARLGDAIAAGEHREAIEAAVRRHMALVGQVAEDLKARELLAEEHLANPYYFPHLTLELERGGQVEQRELRPQRVRPGAEADFRGYLVNPVGSAKPIETDYVRALYYHLVQVGAHNFKADVVRDHFRHYDVRRQVEEQARELSRARGVPVGWEQAFHELYAPEGYVLYGTDSRDAFPSLSIDRDKLARRLGVVLTGEDLHRQLAELGLKGVKLLPEDITETMRAGAREVWVVPARVAEALRGISDRLGREDLPIEAALKWSLGKWKQWKLFMPWNHVRYEYGNLVADLEKVFSASPRTFTHLRAAARELRALWTGEGEMSDDLRAALREGVINAITAQEMHQITRLRAFEAFETRMEHVRREALKRSSSALAQPFTNWLGLGDLSSVELSAFREAVFRYAKFKGDLDRIRHGARPDYAGAYWRDIEAIADSRPGANDRAVRQAAQISKSTFGDYGDLTVGGQYLRDKLVPFYSWIEVNFKYHANLLRNLADLRRTGDLTTAQAARAAAIAAGGLTARAAGGIVLRLALPYLAVYLWNNSDDREELEKELSEEDRRRFHVILGRDDSGRVRVLYGNTAFADVAKWFGGPRFAQAAMDWLNGRTDFLTAMGEWAVNLPADVLNTVVGGVGPAAKIPYALASKKSVFPDVLDQRTIPAYDMRRHIVGQMTDELTADIIERGLSKDYLAAKDVGDWARQLILQVRLRDPESWAFYAIRDQAGAFLEQKTGRSREAGNYNAPDQQVLRNFRRSLYRGDVENATRFYLRLLELGYTSERFAASIRAQDPLSELPKQNGLRRQFVESLDAEGRAQLRRAMAYYVRLSASRGREAALFPREAWGERGQQAYLARPQTGPLARGMQAVETIPEEELARRVEWEIQRSLQPR